MSRSGIITLLTDFGLSDAYAAMMKGVILSINRNAELIDITHCIAVGSIFQGAAILKETFSYFPEGTVHIAVVDPGVGSSRRFLALKADGHFFVAPDNGILWPIIEDDKDAEIVELSEKSYFLPHVTRTFHGRDVFAPIAAHISLGIEISQLGRPLINPEKLTLPRPYQKDDTLKGQITRIDNFGNLITNITANNLIDFLADKKPVIHIGDYEIPGINNTYSDKEKGELIALINSSDYLEIAVNLGKASEYLRKESDEIIGTRVKVFKLN
jgi:S-adenosylmethionine hydrolase